MKNQSTVMLLMLGCLITGLLVGRMDQSFKPQKNCAPYIQVILDQQMKYSAKIDSLERELESPPVSKREAIQLSSNNDTCRYNAKIICRE